MMVLHAFVCLAHGTQTEEVLSMTEDVLKGDD